jgi:hypothetical protein
LKGQIGLPLTTVWQKADVLRRNICAKTNGIASIDVNVVENVINKIDTIKQVAYKLITDWKQRRLHPNITADIDAKLL